MTFFVFQICALVLVINTGIAGLEDSSFKERFRGRLFFPAVRADDHVVPNDGSLGGQGLASIDSVESDFTVEMGVAQTDHRRVVRDLLSEATPEKKRTGLAQNGVIQTIHLKKKKKRKRRHAQGVGVLAFIHEQKPQALHIGKTFNPQKELEKNQGALELVQSYGKCLEVGEFESIPADHLLQMADLYRHQGDDRDMQSAEAILQYVVDHPENNYHVKAEAALKLGKICAKNGALGKAEHWFAEARGYEPTNLKMMEVMGDYYSHTNVDLQQGLEWYRHGIEQAVLQHSCFYQALFHVRLGNARVENRVDHYQKALEILGLHGNAELRAQACIGLGNALEGADHYRKALEILGGHGNSDLRAQALIGLGNAREGDRTDYYGEALDLLGKDGNIDLRARALIGLGHALKADKNYDQAKENYQQALALNPCQALKEKIKKALESYNKKERL